jgi:hypothetical protein
MGINFPDSPNDGQVQGGFKYNSSKGVWEGIELAQTASVGDNAPTSPDNGDLWWDSSTGQMYIYYVDGSSNQWISISNPGETGPGVPTVYANLAGFPSSGNSVGDFGIANDNKALYMWNGSAWTRANVGPDSLPELTTTPASTHDLNSDGTNTAITIVASDPEGFPITYSHDTNPASPNQVTNIVENNGVFTLVPSTNTAHAGNFTLRLKASDGVHISSHSIAVALGFSTNFTFDTSKSWINSTYTATNQADITPTSNQIAHTEENAKVGKGYFEVKYISGTLTYSMIGVAGGTFPAIGGQKRYRFGTTYDESVFFARNGRIWKNNGNNYASGFSNAAANDIIMVAYDTDASRVWFGRNGTWISGLDPATDTGEPINLDSTTNIRPAFTTQQNGGENFRIEIISHTQGAQYTIPTGFALA